MIGRHLSFTLLEEVIDKQENREQTIFLLAFLLGDPEIRKIKVWNDLANSFFERYRREIYTYCRYDTGPLNIKRIKVAEPKLFLQFLGGMLRGEMFGNCSYEKLAEYIHFVFLTHYEKSSICNILKDAHEDYQHIHDQIKAEMKCEPKRKKGFFNN